VQQLSKTGLLRFVFSLPTSQIISRNLTEKSRKTVHGSVQFYSTSTDAPARIPSARLCYLILCSDRYNFNNYMYCTRTGILLYTIAKNILTEMIGRHAGVIVRRFMLFLNVFTIYIYTYFFSNHGQYKSIYLKPLYRMMILLKFHAVHLLSVFATFLL